LLRQAVKVLDDAGVTLDQLAAEARLPVEELRRFLDTPGSRARVDVML
jgi:hypothetical protein